MLKKLLPLLALWFLGGCLSVPKTHETPAPDFIFLHQSPAVGDYAVWVDSSGQTYIRYEITQVWPDRVEVRHSVTSKSKYGTNADFKQYYVVSRSGEVRRAWVVYDSGERHERIVASTGSVGSLENLIQLDTPSNKTVRTRAGTFKIDELWTFYFRMELGVTKVNVAMFPHLSSKIPFRIVQYDMLSKAEYGPMLQALLVAEVAGDAYLGSKDVSAMYERLKASSGREDRLTNKLVDYGFAE